MKKYLTFDCVDREYNEFATIEEAREYIQDRIDPNDEGYHPDIKDCKIYELKEMVDYDVVDSKENYKYLTEDEIPEDDDESEAWPYDTDFDEIWQIKFVPTSEI